ncbi:MULTISPECIES: hypothetical protein [unclassified Crossiella]|uniref:hypothetical protein n=1 Tax=unclassified Crossiella TaxID=2620835 RepID=UPI001FFEB343|nr:MULTISPECIES: hypothetical protein [unclassified Crossiella]MCK2245433.1 hypothetical protein [Crossiella sp. S99.2]MCK2259085.1 hypothetical protein [Crossiella sp. S99.1]
MLRLPIEDPDESGYEHNVLVALAPVTLPSASFRRSMVIQQVWETCEILLRMVGPGFSTAEADDWIQRELATPHAARRSAAVVWPDQCVLRRWSGLRLEITHSGSGAGWVPWAMVPAVAGSVARPAHSRDAPLPTMVTCGPSVTSTPPPSSRSPAPGARPSALYARLSTSSV